MPGLSADQQVEPAFTRIPELEPRDVNLEALGSRQLGHARVDLDPEHLAPACEQQRAGLAGTTADVQGGPRAIRHQCVDQRRRVGRAGAIVAELGDGAE